MRPAYSKLARRGGKGPRSPVVCGRKHCAGCGHWRHACDFGVHHGKLRARCRACTLRYQRAWHANATDEQRARQREYFRIWSEVQRRKQGIPARNFHHRRTVVDRIEPIYLDPDPLLDALRYWSRGSWFQIVAKSGVPERSINRLLRGESRHVRLDLADKLAHALGIPLPLLYGVDAPVIYGRPPARI